jgi:excisionase family DNA binding protein
MNQQDYQMIIYWSDEDQAYLVEVPELPGCMADGKTRQEALANAEIVIRDWLEAAHDFGREIPMPQGRLLTINETAERLGLSVAMVRRYCSVGKLAARKIGRDWAILRRDVERFAAVPRHSGRPVEHYPSGGLAGHSVAEK